MRVDVYLKAYQVVTRQGAVSEQQENELAVIQAYLEIADAEIPAPQADLARHRLLRHIQSGELPTMPVSGLVLQRSEVAYWVEPAVLLEERVVSRRYEGGYQGISIRIARGLSYRVGASRGNLISETGVVPVSAGELIITSKRVVFRGDKKGFNSRLDKLVDIHLFVDGVRLTDGSGKPRTFRFVSKNNAEIFGAILSYAINHLGDGSTIGAA